MEDGGWSTKAGRGGAGGPPAAEWKGCSTGEVSWAGEAKKQPPQSPPSFKHTPNTSAKPDNGRTRSPPPAGRSFGEPRTENPPQKRRKSRAWPAEGRRATPGRPQPLDIPRKRPYSSAGQDPRPSLD